MSDTTTTQPQTPTTVAEPTVADLQAQVAALQAAAAAAPAPAGPSAEAVVRGKIAAGQLVVHAWDDPTGHHEAYGLAVNVDGSSPLGDQIRVAWFRGLSGLIPAADLEVLEHD